MFDEKNPSSSQWMSEVGVPPADVSWLERITRSRMPRSAGDVQRASDIAERAYQGLLATINPQSQRASALQ